MHAYLMLEDTSFVQLGERCVIGRGHSCGLRIFSSRASREHCHVRRDGERWLLQDLGSSGGTWLMALKQRIGSPYALSNGDRFAPGTTIVTYLLRTVPLESDATRALEAVVAEDPSRGAAWDAYADALTERNDPLGARISAPPVRPELSLQEHLAGADFRWSHGHICEATLVDSMKLTALLASRLSRLMVSLTVHGDGTQATAQRIAEALAQSRLPALRTLTLHGWHEAVAVTMPASPRLGVRRLG